MMKKSAGSVLTSLRGFVKREAYLVNREARYERRLTASDARHSLRPRLGTSGFLFGGAGQVEMVVLTIL
jgi:hypothetical protein